MSQQTVTPIVSQLQDRWQRFTILKVGTGASSYFTVNGGTAIPAENDQSQDIALCSVPSFSIIEDAIAKTALVFSAVTTAILEGIESAVGEDVDFGDYNLKTAVADTNIVRCTSRALLTSATKNLVARITVTVETMRDIADGCSVDIWLDISRLVGA